MERQIDVEALYAYQAREEGELSFECGALLKILDRSDPNWWMAYDKTTGDSGYVPQNYVSETGNTESTEDSPYAAPEEVMQQYENHSKEEDSTFCVFTKFPYKAERGDELSFECNAILKIIGTSHSNQGWWKAKDNKGQVGLIPSNYVEKIASDTFPKDGNKIEDFKDKGLSKQQKQHNADLLVERKDPFPVNKAVEAISSPGVKNLTKQLTFDFSNSHNNSNTKKSIFQNEVWYFGKISRHDCERMVGGGANVGDFIIRDSESTAGNFSLSLKTPDCIKHYRILHKNENYIIGHRSFKSVHELVSYYSTTKIYTSYNGNPVYLSRAAKRT